ncbi:hypothetical protein E3N88_40974 [Mikania micrantha]|uniref:Uncharacterized protein n=1 Tax=Mikania micrantha TaxID=192012 RepID=A0A5N6LP84_9ASTR|nr:hypothetical protein E3N88_40974 [Mikania micrantha]
MAFTACTGSNQCPSVRIEKARRAVLASTGRLDVKSLYEVAGNVCTMNETGRPGHYPVLLPIIGTGCQERMFDRGLRRAVMAITGRLRVKSKDSPIKMLNCSWLSTCPT